MNIAILLSAGRGCRLNSNIPKQYIKVAGEMIIEYSLKVLLQHEMINGLVICCEDKWQEKIKEIINKYNKDKFIDFAKAGETRQLSIYNSLKKIENIKVNSVFIHDAARPMLTKEMITDYYNAFAGHEGLMPVLPMKDTVYSCENGRITGLLERDKIFAGQAPEIFVYEKYMKANEVLIPDKIKLIKGSSEPAILYGMDLVSVPGNEQNYKITTKDDLERFRKSKI